MNWEAIGVVGGFVITGIGFSAWLHKIYRIADTALNEIRHLNGLLERLELANKDDHAHIWEELHAQQKQLQEHDRAIARLDAK